MSFRSCFAYASKMVNKKFLKLFSTKKKQRNEINKMIAAAETSDDCKEEFEKERREREEEEKEEKCGK